MTRITVLGLLGVFTLGLAAPAAAQFFRDDSFMPKLTEEDHAFAEKVARVDLNGKDPGSVAAWKNDKTGNSGTVKLIRNYTWQGHSCRQVVHAFKVKNEQPQQWQTNLCLMKDGAWKWPEPPRRLR